MNDLPALRLQLADLIRLHDAHAAQGNASFVAYIEQMIAKTRADIELAERPS